MVLVYTTVEDEADDEGYDQYCQQLTAKAEIGLRYGLRHDCERCECSSETYGLILASKCVTR